MMQLLLDTKTLIWWHDVPHKLPKAVQTALQTDTNQVFISVATAWEMQIKMQLGKLNLSKSWDEIIETEQTNNGFEFLNADQPHIRVLDSLPFHHKDPFDRLLIAQTIHEKLTLVSNDQHFPSYPVTLLW